jgi:hypothetical protein
MEGMAKAIDEFLRILNGEHIFSGDDVIDMQEVTDQMQQMVLTAGVVLT